MINDFSNIIEYNFLRNVWGTHYYNCTYEQTNNQDRMDKLNKAIAMIKQRVIKSTNKQLENSQNIRKELLEKSCFQQHNDKNKIMINLNQHPSYLRLQEQFEQHLMVKQSLYQQIANIKQQNSKLLKNNTKLVSQKRILEKRIKQLSKKLLSVSRKNVQLGQQIIIKQQELSINQSYYNYDSMMKTSRMKSKSIIQKIKQNSILNCNQSIDHDDMDDNHNQILKLELNKIKSNNQSSHIQETLTNSCRYFVNQEVGRIKTSRSSRKNYRYKDIMNSSVLNYSAIHQYGLDSCQKKNSYASYQIKDNNQISIEGVSAIIDFDLNQSTDCLEQLQIVKEKQNIEDCSKWIGKQEQRSNNKQKKETPLKFSRKTVKNIETCNMKKNKFQIAQKVNENFQKILNIANISDERLFYTKINKLRR